MEPGALNTSRLRDGNRRAGKHEHELTLGYRLLAARFCCTHTTPSSSVALLVSSWITRAEKHWTNCLHRIDVHDEPYGFGTQDMVRKELDSVDGRDGRRCQMGLWCAGTVY